ncbi:MAG TPA: molybdopterin-synthase adenylyltransferase MoeB [Pseudomonadales bacterium]
MTMNDEQLLRYSRQILLPQWDIAGQEAALSARVLIVGLGGLGSPAALYLAAAGVGHLVLNDHDAVDLSNLQRQIVHTSANIGMAKTQSAKLSLQALNPDINVSCIDSKLDEDGLKAQIEQADVVLDCSDNFTTRHLINRLCVQALTPLVSGAAIGLEGQISVFDSRDKKNPCYACLYPEWGDETLSCAESGVMAPLVGIIGATQAMEALKLLSGMGQPLTRRLLLLDARAMEWRSLTLKKDPACKVCSSS